jgi:osmotically-inducible protein OsmY
MYENHRNNFGRRRYEDERGEREQDWRRGEERYRRETADYDRFGENRYGDQPGAREFGYGRTFGDDQESGWFGSEPGTYGSRPQAGEQRWSGRGQSDRGRSQQRSGWSYGGSDYSRPGDPHYFTGQQGSWAVRSPHDNAGYSPAGFGADYRDHGYGSDRYGEHRGFIEKAGDEIASWFGDEEAARRREQDHRGRGPKNYVRSDERIRDDANDCLTEDWRIDASDVTVRVENGEVTLDGTVPDRAAKRRAEDLVEDISGVKHVQNNLRVAGAELSAQSRGTSDSGGMISGAGNLQPSSSAKTSETA